MFVAASLSCFAGVPLTEALDRLVHLEYTAVEMDIGGEGNHLQPAHVLKDFPAALARCRETHRLDICAFFVHLGVHAEDVYEQFKAICRLAKATKVVTITVPSAELGTPFNEEVEHLRQLVNLASVEGIRVSIKTQVGRISQDPDTLQLLCNHVKGLGITFDPSHFVFGPHAGADYEPLLKHTYHVHLRDTSKEKLQVRVGQGEIEYGRLITQLRQAGYDRALCVDIHATPELEGEAHMAELRKLRLLLESLLL